VLVFGEPSVFTPSNTAIAINVGCDDCETLASAYQYVWQTGRPVHFTADGNRRLARIRQELQSLRRRDDLSVWEIQAIVQRLADELADVLEHDLVPAGRR
jgi:beta-mannanase